LLDFGAPGHARGWSGRCGPGCGAAAADWYPSRWGKDDTLGAVILITDDSVANAARLVPGGRRYALGMEVSRDTPAF